jgi:anti-sigma-K factor RskA
MGELTREEMEKVDYVAERYPEVKKELDKLNADLHEYARATNKFPDKNLLTNALSEIDSEMETARLHKLDTSEVILQQAVKSSFSWWKVAAAILLVVSAGLNIYFYSQWQNSEADVLALSEQNGFLANEVNQRNVEMDNQSQQLAYANLRIAHFMSKDNIHVRMEGSDLSPESFANVFWNKKSNAVFISVDNLPEPPHGHQYQLWAIKAGQAPIDAGIFDHSQLVQELKVIKGDVAAFAVTLEKEGGVQNASVDKTYVKGFLKKT